MHASYKLLLITHPSLSKLGAGIHRDFKFPKCCLLNELFHDLDPNILNTERRALWK